MISDNTKLKETLKFETKFNTIEIIEYMLANKDV